MLWRLFVGAVVVASLCAPGFAIGATPRVEMRFVAPEAQHDIPKTAKAAIQAQLVVTRVLLSDNADDDGWADTAETIAMTVELRNISNSDLSGVRLRLTSEDPTVGCMTRSLVVVGDIDAGATVLGPEAFEWIVDPSAVRATVVDELTATFQIHIDAAEYPNALPPQPVTLILDLNATGGEMPTTWYESFESGFGAFTTMHVDEHLNPPDSDLGNRAAGVINADGARCQYSDPDWSGAASYGNGAGEQCFPNNNGVTDLFYFALGTDRAFSGIRSLRNNVFLNTVDGYSTPTSQIDAVETTAPVNLGYARVCSSSRSTLCDDELDCPIGESCEYASPKLTLKHQVSHLDHRSINVQSERTLGRSVVAVQLADATAARVGHWIKIYPYVNVYDSQANSNFFACTFDPPDDGNTESDFFDPTDPVRSQGPSSTCAPEFSFAHQGDTDGLFDPLEVGDAIGPGLEGSFGIGTWVEPAFDLSRFRGRRLRLRFLSTDRKNGGARHWEQAFHFNPHPGDDGWFIDDVTITDALVTAASVTPDLNDNAALEECGDYVCGQSGGVQIVLEVTPGGPTGAPGDLVVVDASGSTVDVCLDGTLEYRLWIDSDADGAFDPDLDVIVGDWDYRGRFTDTPIGATHYSVEVRCETAPGCGALQTVTVDVGCPGAGDGVADHTNAFLHNAAADRRDVLLDGTLGASGKDVVLHWTTESIVDVVRGNLAQLRTHGGFGVNETCAADNQTAGTSFVDSTGAPNSGDALFWLLRSAEECNDPGAGGSYGQLGEAANRDAILICPD